MNQERITLAISDWDKHNSKESNLLRHYLNDDRTKHILKEYLKNRFNPAIQYFLNHKTQATKPLHEPLDKITKRQRNTDAARRSRLKKREKLQELENRLENLKSDNGQLRIQVAVLESDVEQISTKEQVNKQRVLHLEAQLAFAHQKLLSHKS